MKSKEHLLTSENRAIKVWLFFPDSKGLSPVVVICHGIPGSKPAQGDRGYFPLAKELASWGFACVVFNFSGCGESSGNIDLNVWDADLLAVYDFVSGLPGLDNTEIHIIGFSAGGAAAVKFITSERKKIKSLMLLATPADISQIIPDNAELMVRHFRELGLIKDAGFPCDINGWYKGFSLLKAENLIRWLPQGLPVCIVHGDRDTVVPVSHAERIYQAAPHPKKFIILEGAPHQLRKDDRIAGIILIWLREQKT
jgi:alpha-beta hydrolase superfamily lysophospholipase